MSLHFNDFAGQPILTHVYAPSPGYVRKAIDLKQHANSHDEVDELIRLNHSVG